MMNNRGNTTTSIAVNGSMSPSSAANSQSQGLKTYFKTPEGRFKLHSDKSHPPGLLPYALGKSVTQITLVQLKERTTQEVGVPSSSYSASSGVRYVAAKFLGSGNGSRGLNGTSKANGGASRNGSMGGLNGSNSMLNSNFDGKGTYLLFNVGDTLYVGDLNSQDKDPIKAIHFSNSNPVCHAFDSEAKDGHDLLIGLNSGDVYSISLRQQLQDAGKKLVGELLDPSSTSLKWNNQLVVFDSRCTSVAWIPGRDGAFVVAHADGNLYSKDGTGDASFPIIKDQTQFSVAHAKSSKSNPIMRWHICQGSIHSIAFSTDGKYLATVGRDGIVFICHPSVDMCQLGDGKYILTGGEDDLVQVWSMEDRKVVAWGEGHNSWVSGVAFDSYWSPPNSEDTGENVMYRFGSVGQDTQLLLWDLSMDEIVVPLRRCPPGGSPTFSSGSPSSHWDSIVPAGTLQPAPSMRDVPKLSPLVAHRVHSEPQSGLIFTQESVLTACREGHVKIWMRPGDQQSSNSKATSSSSSKGKTTSSSKIGSSSYK
ncbi:hypothetical protein TEA_002696 [Camellia sinensis var. sinensis]|uniref:Uncharacterized protein n=1 Tax=Camellia sinensis var. sinensis TaxID=542762 RepID=A0A4S4D9Z2_CAMSN|nr:hypothetical protein TEA_002696 [Camellia sinensis var. sinensis]